MILEQNKENVELYGDVQQNKVSIDPKNIEHVITILSSNLYSNPTESFLRETICNAVDSHKEAGSTEPVVLLFKQTDALKYDVIIRDYGTGISPERFNQIYKFIGSSTKRDSNDYIGSFGIGRFSALSVSNVVHITSYYEGTAYCYIMAKNGGGIDIDLISKIKTEEHNGVEIKIETDNESLDNYANAIPYLYCIPNLYIQFEGQRETGYMSSSYNLIKAIDAFNDKKEAIFDNFKVISAAGNNTLEPKIILGNVLYRVDLKYVLPLPAPFDKLKGYRYCDTPFSNILIPFEIGTLDITPNREALIYSERTVNALKEGYVKAFTELKKRFIDDINTCTNIVEWYYRTKDCLFFLKFPDGSTGELKIGDLFGARSFDVPYKGKKRSHDVENTVWTILHMRLSTLPFSFIVQQGEILNTYNRKKLDLQDLIKTDRHGGYNPDRVQFVITSKDNFGNLAKTYAKEKYSSNGDLKYYVFMPKYSLREMYEDMRKYQEDSYDTDKKVTKDCLFVCKEFLKAFSDRVVYDDIMNSQEFLDWKEARKSNATPAVKRTSTDPYRVYISASSSDRSSYYYGINDWKTDIKKVDEIIDWTVQATSDKNCRTRAIIYGELHSPYWTLLKAFIELENKNMESFIRRFIIVKAAANNIAKHFKDLPRKFIPVEDFIYQMKGFQKYLTYRKFIKGIYDTNYDSNRAYILTNISDNIIEADAKKLIEAIKYQQKIQTVNLYLNSEHVSALNDSLDKFKEHGEVYDMDLVEAYKTYDKYAKALQRVVDLYDSKIMSNVLFVYFCMKNKLFRMNFEQYDKIKNLLKFKVQ